MSLLSRRRVIVVAVFLLALLVVTITPAWRQVQRILQPVVVPVIGLGSRAGSFLAQLGKLSSLQRQTNQLRADLAAVQAHEAVRQTLEQENKRLRQLAAVPLPAATRSLGAEVIGEQADETGRRYLLNRGRRDDLVVGLPVVAGTTDGSDQRPQAVLVGVVTSVSERVSSMSLITSAESKVLAEVLNAQQSPGLIVGEFNLAMRFKFVPVDDQVAVDDLIVTSRRDPLVPAGLLIGRVTAVERLNGEFFQSATVVPAVPLDRFSFLAILLPQL